MSWDWNDTTLASLHAFLEDRNLRDGDAEPRRIGDGHSNLTYLINVVGGQAVLRRPPPPPVPKGANDMLREARILSALDGQDVPVPRVLAVAQAGDVIDVPFYIMSHIPGPIVTDRLPDVFHPLTAPRAMTLALVDGLAQLHNVDYAACGLVGFGQPEEFNVRHLKRIEALMAMREGHVPVSLADMARLLKERVPKEAGAAILHNDYRLGNVIWSEREPPRLLAILDWELATLGDPLLDVGYFACCYPIAGETLNPTQDLSAALLAPNAPDLDAIFSRYADATGRDLAGIAWYAAMAAWKLAVLYDYQQRQGRDSYYDDTTQVPRFLASATQFADRL